MQRGKLATVSGVVLLVAATAHAGSVVFTPVGATIVPIGTEIQFDAEIQSAFSFDLTDVLIGSPDATDIGFVTGGAWDTAFPGAASNLSFDQPAGPAFAQNMLLNGNVIGDGFRGPNLAMGTLKIITTGMSPGTYTVDVSANDSFTIRVFEGGNPDVLSGSLTYTLTPEPGSLLMLVLGAALLRRRR